MIHYEINLQVKDIQILSGFAYTPSKNLLQEVKKSYKMNSKHWLSLQPFCSYVDISYGNALAVLNAFYEK